MQKQPRCSLLCWLSTSLSLYAVYHTIMASDSGKYLEAAAMLKEEAGCSYSQTKSTCKPRSEGSRAWRPALGLEGAYCRVDHPPPPEKYTVPGRERLWRCCGDLTGQMPNDGIAEILREPYLRVAVGRSAITRSTW